MEYETETETFDDYLDSLPPMVSQSSSRNRKHSHGSYGYNEYTKYGMTYSLSDRTSIKSHNKRDNKHNKHTDHKQLSDDSYSARGTRSYGARGTGSYDNCETSDCAICTNKKDHHEEPSDDCYDDCDDGCGHPGGCPGVTGPTGPSGPPGAGTPGVTGPRGVTGPIGPARTGGIDLIDTPIGNNALLVINPMGPSTTLKMRGACQGKNNETIIWESLVPDSMVNPGNITVSFTSYVVGCAGVIPGFMAFVHCQPINKVDGTIVGDYEALKAVKATNLPTNGGNIETYLYSTLVTSRDFTMMHTTTEPTGGIARVTASNSFNVYELYDMNIPRNLGDTINGFVMGPYLCAGTAL